MIVTKTATPVDDRQVLGETFVRADKDSAFAVYERNGRTCGITYEMGRNSPYLRVCPGYQLPPFARDKRAWGRAMWELDCDLAIGTRLDESDGELLYRHKSPTLPDSLEDDVADILAFFCSDLFYDAVIDFVKDRMA